MKGITAGKELADSRYKRLGTVEYKRAHSLVAFQTATFQLTTETFINLKACGIN